MKIKIVSVEGGAGGILVVDAETGQTIPGITRLSIEANAYGHRAQLEFADAKYDLVVEAESEQFAKLKEVARTAIEYIRVFRTGILEDREDREDRDRRNALRDALVDAGYSWESYC